MREFHNILASMFVPTLVFMWHTLPPTLLFSDKIVVEQKYMYVRTLLDKTKQYKHTHKHILFMHACVCV